MKGTAHPSLAPPIQEALASYEDRLREREGLVPASLGHYVSDPHHFITWYEAEREAQIRDRFIPQEISAPAPTRYRASLQTVLGGRNQPLVSN